MRGSLAYPLLERAAALSTPTLPTLIIWGDRDRILPVAGARALRKRIAGAQMLIYADSGHCPMLDAPARFNRELARFLEGHPVGV